MEIQHVNVKLMLAAPGEPTEALLGRLIPVFHAWIREQRAGDLLLDVADYRHVPAGPGLILIGHEANYSVDNTDGRLGVRYNRKAALDGSNQDRLRQATLAALEACRRLEEDPALQGEIRFGGRELEILINDRLLAPNLDTTRAAFRPELETFAGKLFAGGAFSISFVTEPRRLLTASLDSARSFSVTDLLSNLNA